mgnify:CR=1 FL=1
MAPSPLRSPLRFALLLLAVLALASAPPPPAAGKLPRLRGRVRRHTNATIFAQGGGTANATAARAQRAARRAAHPKGVHLPHSRKKRMTALGVVALVVIVLTLLCCACRRLRQWQRDRMDLERAQLYEDRPFVYEETPRCSDRLGLLTEDGEAATPGATAKKGKKKASKEGLLTAPDLAVRCAAQLLIIKALANEAIGGYQRPEKREPLGETSTSPTSSFTKPSSAGGIYPFSSGRSTTPTVLWICSRRFDSR